MARYIKTYANTNAIKAAIEDKSLGNPYVVYNQDLGAVDFNTYKPKDWSKEPLTFTALAAGDFMFKKQLANLDDITAEYSLNDGPWTEMTSNYSTAVPVVSVVEGDSIKVRATRSSYNNGSGGQQNGYKMYISNNYELSGNIMSIIDATGYTTNSTLTVDYCLTSFQSSTRVVSAKNLVFPTGLTASCFRNFFYTCDRLTTAPEILPSTTLANDCYATMFYGCSSLTTTPELPALTLQSSCYSGMFKNCTQLTTAPILSASTTVNYAYSDMFNGCTSLNYVKCLVQNKNGMWPTSNWLSGVAATGTFVKKAGVTWETGVSGIPSGWDVVEE